MSVSGMKYILIVFDVYLHLLLGSLTPPPFHNISSVLAISFLF
jgi:hypothetical protein